MRERFGVRVRVRARVRRRATHRFQGDASALQGGVTAGGGAGAARAVTGVNVNTVALQPRHPPGDRHSQRDSKAGTGYARPRVADATRIRFANPLVRSLVSSPRMRAPPPPQAISGRDSAIRVHLEGHKRSVSYTAWNKCRMGHYDTCVHSSAGGAWIGVTTTLVYTAQLEVHG
eukprot:1190442-Prorocentrum_minimum.AAC.4